MSQVIVLDTGVIGLVTNPKQSTQSERCAKWLQYHLISGTTVIIPEIADYELRRELLRANKDKGLQLGQPTAHDKNIDADMILISQTTLLSSDNVVIATTNLRHLSRFTTARTWTDIG